jgi:hypothetical protein
MGFFANDRVSAHQVAYVLDAVLAHLFGPAERPAHTDDCSVMLFDPRFPRRDPSCIFVRRASSNRAFQAVIRALVLLPRKMERNVSFVLITSPFSTVILLATNNGHKFVCYSGIALNEFEDWT